MADQININNQSNVVFDDQEQENPQNEVEEVDELNKAKWMNCKPPSRLSGPLLTYVMILLFQNENPKLDYKVLPSNYHITEDTYDALQRELQENHVPNGFLNIVTKKSIEKQVKTLKAKANISTSEKGTKTVKKEENERQLRENFSIRYKAEKIQKVKNISVLSNAKENILEINSFIQSLSVKTTYHDRDVNNVKDLYDKYKIDGNDLANSAISNTECASEANLYDESILQLLTLLRDSDTDVDWVEDYFDALEVEKKVKAHTNEGRTFNSQRGSKKGTKRKKNGDDVSEVRGGTKVVTQLSNRRLDTLIQKLYELSTFKNLIADNTQSIFRDESLILTYSDEDANNIANSVESNSYLIDPNHEDVLESRINDLTSQLVNAFQERLRKENNKNDGINLTKCSQSENILLVLDPLSEMADNGVAIGQNAAFILPILLMLLKAGVQDDRQYEERKRASVLIDDNDILKIIDRNNKRNKRNKNTTNDNYVNDVDDVYREENNDNEDDEGDGNINIEGVQV